jgi:hypothetical protein
MKYAAHSSASEKYVVLIVIERPIPRAQCTNETIKPAGKDRININHVRNIQISL